MDSLEALPHNTAHMHQILFILPLPFLLKKYDFNLFWPLVDNIYSEKNKNHIASPPIYINHHMICRFQRARSNKAQKGLSSTPSSQSSRAFIMKKAKKQCNVIFKILEFQNHVEFWPIGPFEKAIIKNHTYSLDESDANKHNSLLRGLAQVDIAKGYAPAAVIGSLRGNGNSSKRARLNATGGAYLSQQDAINSRFSWRLANPNALFATQHTKNNIRIQSLEAFKKLKLLK